MRDVQQVPQVRRPDEVRLAGVGDNIPGVFLGLLALLAFRREALDGLAVVGDRLADDLLEAAAVVGQRFRLDEVIGVADVHVPLRLLVVGGEAMAHELMGAGATDPLDAEGEARVLQRGAVPLPHQLLEEAVAELIAPGLAQRRVIAAYTLNNPEVIRIEPALTIPEDQLDRGIDALAEAIGQTAEILSQL